MKWDTADFQDRVAVVTGASRGLGNALALALARLGVQVVGVARNPDRLERAMAAIEADGGRAVGFPCDVSDPDSVRAMADRVAARFDRVDMLVNNAGIQGRIDWVVNTDPEEWDRIMAVNLKGPFLCCRAFLPGMIQRRNGRIVNVAAGVGEERVDLGVAAYYAAKAGLVNFTRQLAAEVKRHGIHVNAIDPAGLATELSDEILEAEELAPEFQETQTNLNRGPRLRPPEAIVPMVLFLLSSAADMMTGRLLQAAAPDDVQYLQL